MKAPQDNLVLSRLAFGADGASRADLAGSGFDAWLDAQLHPRESQDADCRHRLAELQLHIKYAAAKDWPAVDEMRPLQYLDAPIEKAAVLYDPAKPAAGPEKARPRVEVMAATLQRAVYSRWQLRELLCDFWHNHFNVYAWDTPVGIALPAYDREVIRAHCLGNFRELLEAVAKSPAMLWFLNNRSSRTGAPNENYARELFELHTLGRDAYLNGLYNRWREVPGALEGKPEGYIDQDVYEAARAFTGWGMEDGSGLGSGQSLPRTGRFIYVAAWHDNYQKRVLATEFDPFQKNQADGQKVLDLAAFHPATARFLARKLCIRLIADHPPQSIIASSAKVWHEQRDKPDQIARVVAHIAKSQEFRNSQGAKVKRPLELAASYLRATGIEFTPTEGVMSGLENAGQRLYGWPTPTGYPDVSTQWLGAGVMRQRWSLLAGLTENWWNTGNFDPLAATDGAANAQQFVDAWVGRLHGSADPGMTATLLDGVGLKPDQPLRNLVQARRLVAWAAMAPDFQLR